MGQPHFHPAIGQGAVSRTDRPDAGTFTQRAGMRPPEGRCSPWSDPVEEAPPARPDLSAPFLAAVLARVADTLCRPRTDDEPQA